MVMLLLFYTATQQYEFSVLFVCALLKIGLRYEKHIFKGSL